ncbi:MAG TPA: hypothetical protein VF058_03530 [Actinomycetota bacterium]
MTFLVALIGGIVLTPLARAVGLLTGVVDRPDGGELKIHRRPIPLTGGLAVVASMAASLWILGDLPSGWILGAVALALVVGVVDDAFPLPAAVRFLAQVGSGLLLMGAGLRLEPLGIFAAIGVVLLVPATTNAVNLIDGQDGLAGSLGAVAALGLALLLARPGGDPGAALALATAGALIGFLVWNRPPARIFLGNGGAYAVGVLLAVPAATLSTDGWRGLLAAALCLGVFAFELLFTVARRMVFRRPMAGGDRAHSYDLVAARSGDRLRTTIAFGALAILAGGGALVVGLTPLSFGVAVFTLACAAAALLGRGLWRDLRGDPRVA